MTAILRARFPKPQPAEARAWSDVRTFHDPWRKDFALNPATKKLDVVTRQLKTVAAAESQFLKSAVALGRQRECDHFWREEYSVKLGKSVKFCKNCKLSAHAFKMQEQNKIRSFEDEQLAQVRDRLLRIGRDEKSKTQSATGIPGYQRRRPCRHCPFAPTNTRITFACRQRAEEISEQAYRRGFPCHESAVDTSDEDPDGGFEFGAKTQHCAGAVMMHLSENGGAEYPGIGNDDDLAAKLVDRLDWKAPHYKAEELFLRANAGRKR